MEPLNAFVQNYDRIGHHRRLNPNYVSHGTGADVMKRIAAPMVGGVVTSVMLELMVYPVIYFLWKGWVLKKDTRIAGHELQN